MRPHSIYKGRAKIRVVKKIITGNIVGNVFCASRREKDSISAFTMIYLRPYSSVSILLIKIVF